MDPILATGAVSLAGHLVRNLTSSHTRKAELSDQAKVNFAQMLARASNSPRVQQARFLELKGISSIDDARSQLNGLTTQLLQSGELQSFAAGSTGAISVKVNPDDSVTLTTGEGRERAFTLSSESREIANDIRQISEAMRGIADNGLDHAKSATLRFTPGVGVTM